MLEIVKARVKRENKIISSSFANISNHCRLFVFKLHKASASSK